MKAKFLIKDHRTECSAAWKEANDKLHSQRQAIFEGNYITIYSGDLNLIGTLLGGGQPYEAIKYIKEAQKKVSQLDFSKDQRRWLRESLQGLWNSASEQIEERKKEKQHKHQEWLNRQEEYRRKHEEWKEKMEAKIDRLNDLIEKNEGVIQGLQEQIDDLEAKIATAWNDDWADQAQQRVNEKYQKIQDIEQTNRELEAKIAEITARLD
jgi:chromosome segregation ATPase